MSIRKYLRKKARHNMIAEGITGLNRVPIRKDPNNRKSRFAENWRQYVDPRKHGKDEV